MTIEVTDEIRRAYAEAWYRRIGFDDDEAARLAAAEVADPMPWRDAALAAVLAIVERDYSVHRRLTDEEKASLPKPTRRLKACLENWPDAEEGEYDPRCCRWPKSCSCTVYRPEQVTDADLEPER